MATSTPKTYAGYTRCEHCGIYDSDPEWCDLCGTTKHGRKNADRVNLPLYGDKPHSAGPAAETEPRA